jgi:ankyrin repeat protein
MLEESDPPPWQQLLLLAKDGNGNDIEAFLKSRSVSIHKEEPGSGVTAICVAADAGNLETTRKLVKLGAEFKRPCTANGNTPAHFAARQGHVHILTFFDEEGLDLSSIRNSAVIRFAFTAFISVV